MAKTPVVVLYSTTLHLWEAWRAGRPVLSSYRLEPLLDRYPDAREVGLDQCKMADADRARASARSSSKDQSAPT